METISKSSRKNPKQDQNSVSEIQNQIMASETRQSLDTDAVYEYERTGDSTKTDKFGMREMQQRAWEKRDEQYLLIKSPPASGKSRALMYIALDKLNNQGIKKAIIAVPEKIIGRSFAPATLHPFPCGNWHPDVDLCVEKSTSEGKVKHFREFMKNSDLKILVCAHATLRNSVEKLGVEDFQDCLLAVDEFHHVSADREKNQLGVLVHEIMTGTNAHIVALTGSYFRGDNDAILMPEDEARFAKVNYNYYEMLNGYKYLKSLGIGYHFYEGPYTNSIGEVLDINKKTLIHIPHSSAIESTGDKYDEVGKIFDIIRGSAELPDPDPNTGIYTIVRDDKILKVANLVDDEVAIERSKVVKYLQNIQTPEDIDIIIALGMAKEGFDWPECEHTLTVGYRDSMTEIVQIIGRCTRDYEGKRHAQFTNLIAKPNVLKERVTKSVNDMLKAISCSLLMEQVLTPNFNFKPKADKKDKKPSVRVNGLAAPPTERAEKIIKNDLDSLKIEIFKNTDVQRSMSGKLMEPEVVNKGMVPRIIKKRYPDLNKDELESVRQHLVADMVLKSRAGNRFINMSKNFIKIHDLHIDLIDSVNPFQSAYEILSKSFSKDVFKAIQDEIKRTKITMTEDEALSLFTEIRKFKQEHNREPSINSPLPTEKYLAEALLVLRKAAKKARADNEN